MASLELDEIDFEDQYDKVDPIDDEDLDASMTILNESIREQEELESRINRAEWTSTNKDQRTKLEQQIPFNEKKQELYEKLYSRLRLDESDEGTYKIAFENESGTYKDILSPTNRWLVPNAYLRIFGNKFMKDIGFDADKSKSGTKSKIPKKKMKQIEMYVDETDDSTK